MESPLVDSFLMSLLYHRNSWRDENDGTTSFFGSMGLCLAHNTKAVERDTAVKQLAKTFLDTLRFCTATYH